MSENFLSEQQAIRFGRDALLAYQNVLVDWYGGQYKGTYDTLLNKVQSLDSAWLEKVGRATWQSKLGQRRIYESAERVVDKNGLNIVDAYSFNQGFVDEVKSFDFSLFGDAALDLAESVYEPVKDAVTGVSDSLSFLGKNLKYIIALAVGILLFVGYKGLKSRV